MEKIELLAPAKDLHKAKIAILYGADAVYVGGKQFSLRSRASNFEISDMEELVKFAHVRNRKVFVTVNIVFHDEDLVGIKEYLLRLDNIGVDAIIVESLSLVSIVKTMNLKMECHISTQLSTLNSMACDVIKSFGADRIVLGRETTMEEIKMISEKVDLPLEVFIHGGMCSNYSGRCTLSNRMTLRDANRGGCAQSCRWKYHIVDNGKMVSDINCPLSMSSKDLRATAYIAELIKAKVASLKIEGRMKSDYYIAQVVKTYRKMIDEVYKDGELNAERIAYYDRELSKAENRPSDDGFFAGDPDDSKHLYGINGAGVTHDYVAYVKSYDEMRKLALVEVKNKFSLHDKLEVFGPNIDNEIIDNVLMLNEEWDLVELANKPTELLYIHIPFKVSEHDMIRKA